MSKILFVPHGDYEKGVPDPPLTQAGKLQMKKLRKLIPKEFKGKKCVKIGGDGLRHRQSFKELLDESPTIISPFAGRKEVEYNDKIIFPDGQIKLFENPEIQAEFKKTIRETVGWLHGLLSSESSINIIIGGGGRILLIATGAKKEQIKPGSLYLLELNEVGKITFKDL